MKLKYHTGKFPFLFLQVLSIKVDFHEGDANAYMLHKEILLDLKHIVILSFIWTAGSRQNNNALDLYSAFLNKASSPSCIIVKHKVIETHLCCI